MAKIGMLVLQRGRWGERQVVPASWIEESTRPHAKLNGTKYGYLWWLDDLEFGDQKATLISARGNGGQAIFVVPEYDLVAVTTAGYYNSDRVKEVNEIFYWAVLASIPELKIVERAEAATK